MILLIHFVLAILTSPFKSKSRLEAENAALRHQLTVLRRNVRGRAKLTNNDRWFFVQLYRWFPSVLEVLTIIRPETLVRRSANITRLGLGTISRVRSTTTSSPSSCWRTKAAPWAVTKHRGLPQT